MPCPLESKKQGAENLMDSKPTRKQTRLRDYDYSQNGAYFVTICTKEKSHIFGKITNQGMQFTPLGQIAWNEIWNIPIHRKNVEICHAVVMPNHVHLLLLLLSCRGMTCHAQHNTFGKPLANGLPMIIGAYKAAVTRNAAGTTSRAPTSGIWQRGYYDHIVRNDTDFQTIWQYIDENPLKWQLDCYFTP